MKTTYFANKIIIAHLASFLLALPCWFCSVGTQAPDVADAVGWSPTVYHPQAEGLEPKPPQNSWCQKFSEQL